ncbi:hypothetical protein L7E55_14365 [Pelotomaculum isophthalicicum JI]|uniref:tRNA(Ile2) 2-agmatinylcytidine synthetase n=1 Tax=Pelotomaculum isophthalicicum JI TaxID=947010 RepID=A0A9X4H442_9FIRM|nr:hypothetical protein [Pelotomaculum isophthalicicum]MDF9409526.1 hypothetical protein [Pelotomaculum isophthalicicum JI]
MRIIVCIDDTDNIDSDWGTGELAAKISETMEELGWGKSYGVTRHQLLVHPDIPYTSHNSSMCFEAEIAEPYLDVLIDFASDFLSQESAEGSDPGLCVAVPERLSKPGLLIDFGRKAKETVVSKQEAYNLAQQLGIHLSEHGGDGQGVIGALAGAGLRLSGNDGRLRGKLKIKNASGVISVRDIISQTCVDVVRVLDGAALNNDETVRLGKTVKPVLLEGKFVLFVFPAGAEEKIDALWQTCTKEQLRKY